VQGSQDFGKLPNGMSNPAIPTKEPDKKTTNPLPVIVFPSPISLYWPLRTTGRRKPSYQHKRRD